jgi:RNA polymerase sigma-70 factor (ECF subfamily)
LLSLVKPIFDFDIIALHFKKTLSTQPHIADEILIKEFQQSEKPEKVFEIILDRYTTKVYWHVRRIVIRHEDADDVTQNTFIKVWKNLHGFRGDAKLYTWIYRIATNEALHFIQQKKQKLNVSLNETGEILIEQLHADSYFNGNQAELKLQEAILALPDKQRLVFNMKYFQHLKYEEMSAILGTSVGALKASYHLAVKKIEKHLT